MNRTYRACTGGLIGWALGYAAPVYARLPHAYYDPIGRRWTWVVDAGAIPMGYLGLVMYGAAGALVGAALFGAIPFSAGRSRLLAAWTMTALTLVLAYFTWNNWP